MYVIKQSGKKEKFDINKFHKMVDEACDGLTGVSPSLVEMNSNIQFYDGMHTKEIQKILVRSASDLISVEHPNYQYVAARLLLFGLYKEVYGQFDPIPLREIVKKNIKKGVYDPEILSYYTKDEWVELNDYIKHKRDFDFAYAGIQQLVDKYLVQNRNTGEIFETPQIAYMLIAAIAFKNYPKETRIGYVKKFYDAASQHVISLPTPIMAGVRTPKRQYASCVLIDVDDTLKSIFSSVTAVGNYTAARAGIGLNIGRVRAIKSNIRGGEVEHTGLIPFLKVFEATTKSCQQSGIRGGGGTVHVPFWHKEIESVIVLKNNKGTEDNRVRKLDYSIQFSKLFYERFLKKEDITLFSPHEVPGLYEAFGLPEFDELYVKYENDPSIKGTKMSAFQLFSDVMKERAETGRIYLMNIDHVNEHGPFLEKISMSNLCQEIGLVTKPIESIDDTAGRIATCILAAINVGKVSKPSELEVHCDLIVRMLDELIDYQEYPVLAAELYTKEYRTLGVGFTGFAHYLAKNKVKYGEKAALELTHGLTEAFAYYLTKSSVQLAREKGKAPAFDKSKYSKGILPIDSYKKDVDTLGEFTYNYDWEALREEVVRDGLRNLTLMAQMPVESSSVITNSTNGIDPPRNLLSVKKSKKGTLKQLVPGFTTLKNQYTLLWDMDNKAILNTAAIIQKFFDQSISLNTNYVPENYPNKEVPLSIMLMDLLYGYKMGLKNFYYHNTKDGKEDSAIEEIKVVAPVEVSAEDDENCEACAI